MQSAFGFLEACPASGAGSLPRLDGAGAMCASDAREILVVQRVVEHVMSVRRSPRSSSVVQSASGLTFTSWIFFIPLYFPGVGTVFRLVAADGRFPMLSIRTSFRRSGSTFRRLQQAIGIRPPQLRP